LLPYISSHKRIFGVYDKFVNTSHASAKHR
jgi:hypothetical protein